MPESVMSESAAVGRVCLGCDGKGEAFVATRRSGTPYDNPFRSQRAIEGYLVPCGACDGSGRVESFAPAEDDEC